MSRPPFPRPHINDRDLHIHLSVYLFKGKRLAIREDVREATRNAICEAFRNAFCTTSRSWMDHLSRKRTITRFARNVLCPAPHCHTFNENKREHAAPNGCLVVENVMLFFLQQMSLGKYMFVFWVCYVSQTVVWGVLM